MKLPTLLKRKISGILVAMFVLAMIIPATETAYNNTIVCSISSSISSWNPNPSGETKSVEVKSTVGYAAVSSKPAFVSASIATKSRSGSYYITV